MDEIDWLEVLRENERLGERVVELEDELARKQRALDKLAQDNEQLRRVYESRLRKMKRKLKILEGSRSPQHRGERVRAADQESIEEMTPSCKIQGQRDEDEPSVAKFEMATDFESSGWAPDDDYNDADSCTSPSTPNAHGPDQQTTHVAAADPDDEEAARAATNTTMVVGEGGGRTPIEAWLESHFTAAQRQLPLLGPELERRRLAGLQPPPPQPPPSAGTSEQQDADVDDGGGGDGDDGDGDGGVDEGGELQQRQRLTIEDLPVEVLCAVFAAVEAPWDVLACSATCRAWATILGALRSATTSGGDDEVTLLRQAAHALSRLTHDTTRTTRTQESDALWKTLVLTSRRWLRHGRASALVPPPRTSWKQYYRMRCHLGACLPRIFLRVSLPKLTHDTRDPERNWRVGTMLVKTIPLSSTVRSFDYRPGGTLTSLSHVTFAPVSCSRVWCVACGVHRVFCVHMRRCYGMQAGIHFYDVVSGVSQGKISLPFSPMCHQQFDPFLLVGGTGSKLHLYHGTFDERVCCLAPIAREEARNSLGCGGRLRTDDGRLLAVYPHAGRIDEAAEPETISSVACNAALGKFVSATASTAVRSQTKHASAH